MSLCPLAFLFAANAVRKQELSWELLSLTIPVFLCNGKGGNRFLHTSITIYNKGVRKNHNRSRNICTKNHMAGSWCCHKRRTKEDSRKRHRMHSSKKLLMTTGQSVSPTMKCRSKNLNSYWIF